jgi:hypothetical protein
MPSNLKKEKYDIDALISFHNKKLEQFHSLHYFKESEKNNHIFRWISILSLFVSLVVLVSSILFPIINTRELVYSQILNSQYEKYIDLATKEQTNVTTYLLNITGTNLNSSTSKVYEFETTYRYLLVIPILTGIIM